MTPTIVMKDGKPWFAVGSPGGPRIINAVLQTVVNVIDFNMDLQQAIDMPRIHHQWLPDQIVTEPLGLSTDTIAILREKRHKIADKQRSIGHLQAVMIEPGTGIRLGASDSRIDGKAAGY
jgi:gamma-glutamyltranspeptidase/glutathione hydrolase